MSFTTMKKLFLLTTLMIGSTAWGGDGPYFSVTWAAEVNGIAVPHCDGGVLGGNMPWIHGPGDHPDGIVLHFDDNGFASVIGCRAIPIAPQLSMVSEITARTLHGEWSFGFDDWRKDTSITISDGLIGIKVGGQWLVSIPFNSSDALHTYRIEKLRQESMRLLIDGTEVFQIPYAELPAPNFFFDAMAFVVRTRDSIPEDGVHLHLKSYRYHIGNTQFPDEPLCPNTCPADLDGDGVVAVPDLLALLAAWGPCP